jgi:hypothetical protein
LKSAGLDLPSLIRHLGFHYFLRKFENNLNRWKINPMIMACKKGANSVGAMALPDDM